MYISELIGALIAQLAAHGDLVVKLDRVPQYDTHIRGFYVRKDVEFDIEYLHIEPVDR